ncbi:hypothetical protein ASPVEDRAFT_144863 [Aspergillus versicolor CBS 583.65]|uniref:Methyltransferase domain-containing protein n=1 Tax=Aspergillus versicolor CBS 583.65 TaxID=1036611 RepID=A0A1L9Q4Y4_ASPVE|nr:uncharacterized protein ASPVEDRAFT_144863 [Aspergillus versicolor CBS 583.65]OJJ08799.1 hypothetical protein ASPVEDRAFT_144863 [Aspergillus versicolor CBS 583.65]
MATAAVATHNQPAEEWKNDKVSKASRDVAWYQTALTRVPDIAREIFRDYSGIPDDQITDHIHRVRDQAWDILPFPCIGLFRFLDFPAYLQPVYPEVLTRIKSGETFLDLGCCFGQDIRKLVHDGAPGENLIGVDTESRFLDLGHQLFKDKNRLKAHFQTGDVFAEDFLQEWRGKVDIIFLGSFLHLFSFEQQRAIVLQLGRLLRGNNSLVFGRHLATTGKGGTLKENACGWSLYHHSEETIREIWETDPHGKWDVSSELIPYGSESWDNGVKWNGGDQIKQQRFVARRV